MRRLYSSTFKRLNISSVLTALTDLATEKIQKKARPVTGRDFIHHVDVVLTYPVRLS